MDKNQNLRSNELKVIVALTLCKNGKIPSIGDGGFT